MNTYTPDKYTILEIPYKDGKIYKVLGTWSGSYLYGDSWRVNSGIEHAIIDGDKILFYGSSGSCYQCNINSEGVTGSSGMGVINTFIEDYNVKVLTLQECIDNMYFYIEDINVERREEC